MEIKNDNEFYTEAHLSRCIEIPIHTVTDDLNKFVKFKGLLRKDAESTPFYVDGYVIIEETRVNQTGEDEYEDSLVRVKCSKYCSRPELASKSYIVSMPFLIEEAFISYSEFKEALNNFGIPLTEKIENVPIKNFNYDVSLINQKSSFTLFEASKIAANLPLKSVSGFVPTDPSLIHLQEMLSECVKGQNQHNFHLISIELWVHTHDDYEPCSRIYPNGTCLKVSTKIDLELTVIAKSEFLRWCKYMDIETGLYCDQKSIDESIEALKLELSESQEEVSRLRDLYLTETIDKPTKAISYPPELQIAIDAFEKLCVGQKKLPTNKVIEDWLKSESKSRGITHKDGSDNLKGLSNVKAERIASIIKSK